MGGGCLRNASGQRVQSDQWSDNAADHLETMQRHVRPANLVDGAALSQELPVDLDMLSSTEVMAAVKTLKKKRASGPDDVPAEYWQAVTETADGLTCLTLMQPILERKMRARRLERGQCCCNPQERRCGELRQLPSHQPALCIL